jgi:uncharacterized protein YndB with AHSA1/START domain
VASGTSSFEHEVRIRARPETVFSYFTDPARLTSWMGSQATLDPRPGGVCRIAMEREIGATAMSGEFLEVTPFSRVVFTWGWEAEVFQLPPASTQVEVSLEPEGEETVVRLVHSKLPPAAVEFHVAGWQHYCERLQVAAAGGDPGPDEWLSPGVATSDEEG